MNDLTDTPYSTPEETIHFIDLYSRCRHRMFREHLIYNLHKFFPDHEITKAADGLLGIVNDREFRLAVRALAKKKGGDGL